MAALMQIKAMSTADSVVNDLFARAQLAMGSNDHGSAARLLKQVLEVDPLNLGALKTLAVISLQSFQYNAAFLYAANAFEVAGNDAETCNLVGSILYELDKPEPAAAALREALRLQPEDPAAMENYSLVLQALGRTDEAAELAEALVQKQPYNARLWRRYAISRQFPINAPEILKLRKLLRRPGQSSAIVHSCSSPWRKFMRTVTTQQRHSGATRLPTG
jgi:Flp pilus assembly protein TadD